MISTMRTVNMVPGERFDYHGLVLRFLAWRYAPERGCEIAFCRSVGDGLVHAITPDDMEAWRRQRVAKKYRRNV